MAPWAACGVILAGGRSRRMGTNKALIPFRGEPLIARVAGRLRAWCRQVVLVTGAPEQYAFLGLPTVPDPVPGAGPLAGIAAGLMASRYRAALVVACDMPFVDRGLAAYLLSLTAGHDLVVPAPGGVPEPLCAVYTRDCLPAVTALLAAGDYKVAHLLPRVRTRMVTDAEIRSFGPPERLFCNCNSPADLAAALRWAEAETDADPGNP